MKRFLADAILICILVSIWFLVSISRGSDDTRNLVQEQVEALNRMLRRIEL